MKFQPDVNASVNMISRLDGERVWVGPRAYTGSLIVPWQGDALPWAPTATESLAVEHFHDVLGLTPELVIFGSGRRMQFIAPTLYRPLIEQRIGMETMDTAAACRTFNVLSSEGRRVVAALIIEPDALQ